MKAKLQKNYILSKPVEYENCAIGRLFLDFETLVTPFGLFLLLTSLWRNPSWHAHRRRDWQKYKPSNNFQSEMSTMDLFYYFRSKRVT